MFENLEKHDLGSLESSPVLLNQLVANNVRIKMSVVQQDETETGQRKLLNYGHTLGHAIETFSKLSHGQAVGIGMSLAAEISMKHAGLSEVEYERIISLLVKYELPVTTDLTIEEIFELIKLDKKRKGKYIDLVLLKKIGEAAIFPVPIEDLKTILD